jgi:hypothetical protein
MLRLTLLCAILGTTSALTYAADAKATKPEEKEKPFTPGGKYRAHSMERPRPRVITPPGLSSQEKAGQPPSDAMVFFDGKDLSQWKRDPKKSDPATPPNDAAEWKVENGYFEITPKSGGIRTRQKISGDCQWHIEWATPSEVKGNSQGRGNSGVFFDGFPEVQVLDSYQNDTYPDGSAGGLYGKYPPMVNASRKPGEWQSYDVFLEVERKDAAGKVTRPARMTVLHNGIVVQWAREFPNGSKEFGLALQDHNNPGRFRNIWARKLNVHHFDDEGTAPPAAAK